MVLVPDPLLVATTLISIFAEASEAYVRSQLRGLKPGKAVGLDDIPARLSLVQCYQRSST